MENPERKLFNELEKDLALIQTLYGITSCIEITNKLNVLKNLFGGLKSAPNNPTSNTDNTSNLHLEIALQAYEIAKSLKNTKFIQPHDLNEISHIYNSLLHMSAAQLTQIDTIPESDEVLLTCAKILNKVAYYCFTNNSPKMAETLLNKAHNLICNIKNRESKKYQTITAKTTAALILLTTGYSVIPNEILVILKDEELRILTNLRYSNSVSFETDPKSSLYNTLMCTMLLENIKQPTEQDKELIRKSANIITNILIKEMDNIYQFIQKCKDLAETRAEILIKYLNKVENNLDNNNMLEYKLITIKLLKSYCFMKLNNSTNARQSFTFVQQNQKIIKRKFPLKNYPKIRSIFQSIFGEIKKFLDSVENLTHLSVTQPEKENPPSIPSKKKNKKRKKKKNKPIPEASNRNRFFHPQSKSYSDEDIIKLLEYRIKVEWLKIGSVIPFNELTDRLTEELSRLKDEKYSVLILPINCGRHHAFLYVEQNPNKNLKFVYFDLRETISENLYNKINESPNYEIINVSSLCQDILNANSNLEVIKEPKKYDSLLIYFIEHYINWHSELISQLFKEHLESEVKITYSENQKHLLKPSPNTPSMNNTP